MMKFKELRERSGMKKADFARYFDIPYGTMQKWEFEERQPPKYLLDLIEYKLKKEKIIK